MGFKQMCSFHSTYWDPVLKGQRLIVQSFTELHPSKPLYSDPLNGFFKKITIQKREIIQELKSQKSHVRSKHKSLILSFI